MWFEPNIHIYEMWRPEESIVFVDAYFPQGRGNPFNLGMLSLKRSKLKKNELEKLVSLISDCKDSGYKIITQVTPAKTKHVKDYEQKGYKPAELRAKLKTYFKID